MSLFQPMKKIFFCSLFLMTTFLLIVSQGCSQQKIVKSENNVNYNSSSKALFNGKNLDGWIKHGSEKRSKSRIWIFINGRFL